MIKLKKLLNEVTVGDSFDGGHEVIIVVDKYSGAVVKKWKTVSFYKKNGTISGAGATPDSFFEKGGMYNKSIKIAGSLKKQILNALKDPETIGFLKDDAITLNDIIRILK